MPELNGNMPTVPFGEVLQMLQLVSDEQVEEIGQVCRWGAVPVVGLPMTLRAGMHAACIATYMPLLP